MISIVGGVDVRLVEAEHAAEAAADTMKKEVAADIEPPPPTDPKLAVLNLTQDIAVRFYVIGLIKVLFVVGLVFSNLCITVLINKRYIDSRMPA